MCVVIFFYFGKKKLGKYYARRKYKIFEKNLCFYFTQSETNDSIFVFVSLFRKKKKERHELLILMRSRNYIINKSFVF